MYEKCLYVIFSIKGIEEIERVDMSALILLRLYMVCLNQFRREWQYYSWPMFGFVWQRKF